MYLVEPEGGGTEFQLPMTAESLCRPSANAAAGGSPSRTLGQATAYEFIGRGFTEVPLL